MFGKFSALGISLLLAVSCSLDPVQAQVGEGELTELRAALTDAGEAGSSTRNRRAVKQVIRDGEKLIKDAPEAPARWPVLELIFQAQKQLLGLENSDRNRATLFEICEQLSKAPDEAADLRLEADLLLSERDLSRKKATVAERTQALGALISRYRDTPGEARSLMLSARIAPKLEAFDLEKQIERTLSTRFPGDHEVILWRRKYRDFSHLPVQFSGTYKRTDGTELVFPFDGVGHTSLFVFWSASSPELETLLDKVHAFQTRFPEALELFSFNLDELPDAGESLLRKRDLDWTALHLPGGRNAVAYQAYAGEDPLVIRANAHGHAHIATSRTRNLTQATPMEQNFDDPRYLAQLQSLLIGEFLLSTEPGSIPADTFAAIRDCFVAPPMRYRLSRSEALANYEKAEQLCRKAMEKHAASPDHWRLRNHRIIALLGMWVQAIEPVHLEAAVAEARLALNASPPVGSELIPHFCLAKQAIREGAGTPRAILAVLFEGCGENARTHAASAILAIDANAGDLHAASRQRVLADLAKDPALWSVQTFLRDRNHRYRLFKPNYYQPPSLARRIERSNLRSNAAGLDAEPEPGGPLTATFAKLDGGLMQFPEAAKDKLTLLMFVEPPASGDAFPTNINGAVTVDTRGNKRETLGVMQQAFKLAEQHVHKELQVVAAFLSDDTNRVAALMKTHEWPCTVVTLPGGLTNPLVRQLGILSADRVPNSMLLRPDGSIAWKLSGIVHPQVRSEGIGETIHVCSRPMKSHVDRLGMARSMQAFEAGEFKEAIRLFTGPFPIEGAWDGWVAPRLHGRALAHMQLENWEAALVDLDAAIVSHERTFNNKKPCVCQRVADLRVTRAMILDQLGRADEAKVTRELANDVKTKHGGSRYGAIHDRLQALSAKEQR